MQTIEEKRETWRKSSKKYRDNHKEFSREKSAKYQRKLKLEVFSHYSVGIPHCSICGEECINKLVLDHVDGQGKIHREINSYDPGIQTWVWARKHDYPPIFQVLCRDCNLIRSFPSGKVIKVALLLAKERKVIADEIRKEVEK